MAIPEDIDLWSGFPLHLKTEPLDDLFDDEPNPILTKKFFESPTSMLDYTASETDDFVTDAFEEVRPEEQLGTSLEVVGSDSAAVGGIYKPSKLYAYEDFLSFLAREGGINPERLSRLVGDIAPRPEEDFVSFLARSNGIMDEQMINRLRQALKLEPGIDLKSGRSGLPVKMEVDLDLKVREGEDAASFFVRTGSWESASSISEDLASVGLDQYTDEDAESFFRRTEGMSDNGLEGEYVSDSQCGSPVPLISTKHDVDTPCDQMLVEQSGASASSESVGKDVVAKDEVTEEEVAKDEVVVKKRRTSEED